MISLFSLLIIVQSLLIIYLKDAVISVLFLINVFLVTSLLFLIVGAEFLSILLVIVYVGAVSVLFLFVIMLLNLRIVEIYNTFIHYLPLGLFIGVFFFLELLFILFKDLSFLTTNINYDNFFIINLEYKSNLILIAELLYNYYLYYLIIASLILLLGMIGVIALTVDFYKKRKIIKSKKINIINNKIIFWFNNEHQSSSKWLKIYD